MLSKVDANLEFNEVLLRSEAKNFTEVATLTCRGGYSFHSLVPFPPNRITFICNNMVASTFRFITRPWKKMYQSYQFKGSGRPDDLQLPRITHHTQVIQHVFVSINLSN